MLLQIVAMVVQKLLVDNKITACVKHVSWVLYVKFQIDNQRKTIVNSWVRCLESNQLVITSGFPTVNFRKW